MTRSGGAARTQCKVCRHVSREAIDAALVAGASTPSLGAEYGLHPDSIWRHKRHHLSPALQALSGEVQDGKRKSLVDRIEKQIDRVERVATSGEKSGNARIILDATREARGLLELLGKASGELRDSPQVAVNLIASPDWVRLRAAIFEVLSEYPEARAALSGRLLAIEGGQQ